MGEESSWRPWEQFKADQEVLPIPAPPCPSCRYWHPIRNYVNLPSYFGQFDGVRLCHAQEMERDFSCFRDRPQKGV